MDLVLADNPENYGVLQMASQPLTNEDIALRYLEQLPWPPYPFQEQAIFSWFESEDGILVCAPTGTGKTVIAETGAVSGFDDGSAGVLHDSADCLI